MTSKPEQKPALRKKSLVHGIAWCQQCDWVSEDYLAVQKQAGQHALSRGHRVTMELGYVVTILGGDLSKKGTARPG